MEETEKQEVRHKCGRLLIVIRPRGIELACPKCGDKVLYTWKMILMMMLVAEQ